MAGLRRWTGRLGVFTMLVATALTMAITPARADDPPPPAYVTVTADVVDSVAAGPGFTVVGPPTTNICEYGCEGAKFCRSLTMIYTIYTWVSDLVRWRQPQQGQMIEALEMRARALEPGPALLVDQPGRRVGKAAFGIAKRLHALGLEEERPARSEPAQDIVDAG